MGKFIAGNWKMNGVKAALAEIDALKAKLDGQNHNADVVICPPATLLAALFERATGSVIKTGGQDCHANISGAHTGDISAEMVADAGGAYVIVGHSERRTDHGEKNEDVKAKAEAVVKAGLVPIICVGETLEERKAGKAIDVVLSQVKNSIVSGPEVIIAYEPVWAIGTGEVATSEDIAEMHQAIREEVGPTIKILYGGSMKPTNAAEICGIANVDGGLIGGASLKADDFYGIISSV